MVFIGIIATAIVGFGIYWFRSHKAEAVELFDKVKAEIASADQEDVAPVEAEVASTDASAEPEVKAEDAPVPEAEQVVQPETPVQQ